MSKPKILLLDIETAPMLGYIWSLWDQTVSLNQLHSDWHLLSWSAKWLGSPTTLYADQRGVSNIEQDKTLLSGVWKLLNDADIVITQNGKSFDTKKLNARFILNGMSPPSSYRQIDTKLLAKKHFGFTSNKLEYLSDKLCTTKKLKHQKYQGFELWKACLAGDAEAWEEMERYNRQDVLALEELYLKLAPWDNGINFQVYDDSISCKCGSTDVHRRGYYYTNVAKYQKYRCKTCGSETRSRTNLLSSVKRAKLRVGTNR